MLNPTLKQHFDRRIARYALAGSVLFGLPAAAQASVMYSGLRNLPVGPADAAVSINMNPGAGAGQDAINDVFVNYFDALDVIPVDHQEINVSATGINVGPLAFGAPITVGNTPASG